MSGFSHFPMIIFWTSKTFSKSSFFFFQKFEYVSKNPVVFILRLKTMKTAFLLSKQCRRKFYSAPFEQIWKEAFYDPLRVDEQLFLNQLRYIDHKLLLGFTSSGTLSISLWYFNFSASYWATIGSWVKVTINCVNSTKDFSPFYIFTWSRSASRRQIEQR